jgi:NADPH-dependent 2,4-dienoyl-CoA reductase/sulfur reductase-like enzyme
MFSILTRREFLRASALSGAVLALESRCLGRGLQLPRTRVQKIIVIGAGISGLVSAYELMNAGNDVTVLEARTRLAVAFGQFETISPINSMRKLVLSTSPNVTRCLCTIWMS